MKISHRNLIFFLLSVVRNSISCFGKTGLKMHRRFSLIVNCYTKLVHYLSLPYPLPSSSLSTRSVFLLSACLCLCLCLSLSVSVSVSVSVSLSLSFSLSLSLSHIISYLFTCLSEEYYDFNSLFLPPPPPPPPPSRRPPSHPLHLPYRDPSV